MFEVKYLVKNDIDHLDRVFDTEQEVKEWIKSAEEEMVNERFNSMVLATLDVPFSDLYNDCDIKVIKLRSPADFDILEQYHKLHFGNFGENYLDEPNIYPCVKVFIETDTFVEFACDDLNTLIHKFSMVTSALADINKNENKK